MALCPLCEDPLADERTFCFPQCQHIYHEHCLKKQGEAWLRLSTCMDCHAGSQNHQVQWKNCRPCHFFLNGTCKKGDGCSRCHLPHMDKPPRDYKVKRDHAKKGFFAQGGISTGGDAGVCNEARAFLAEDNDFQGALQWLTDGGKIAETIANNDDERRRLQSALQDIHGMMATYQKHKGGFRGGAGTQSLLLPVDLVRSTVARAFAAANVKPEAKQFARLVWPALSKCPAARRTAVQIVALPPQEESADQEHEELEKHQTRTTWECQELRRIMDVPVPQLPLPAPRVVQCGLHDFDPAVLKSTDFLLVIGSSAEGLNKIINQVTTCGRNLKLALLSTCSSLDAGRRLAQHGVTAICWEGEVKGAHACDFDKEFLSRLIHGASVPEAFDAAASEVEPLLLVNGCNYCKPHLCIPSMTGHRYINCKRLSVCGMCIVVTCISAWTWQSMLAPARRSVLLQPFADFALKEASGYKPWLSAGFGNLATLQDRLRNPQDFFKGVGSVWRSVPEHEKNEWRRLEADAVLGNLVEFALSDGKRFKFEYTPYSSNELTEVTGVEIEWEMAKRKFHRPGENRQEFDGPCLLGGTVFISITKGPKLFAVSRDCSVYYHDYGKWFKYKSAKTLTSCGTSVELN